MAHDPLIVTPLVQAQLANVPADTPSLEMPAPTMEQTRTSDAVFAATPESREADQVAGLLGLQLGILLLHDLAVEHFDRPADEDKPRPHLAPQPDA